MATIIAESLSRDHVNTAVQSAVAGDTVVLPAGSGGAANWTSGIIWSAPANVTLIGAGTSATGGGDHTVITDNIASGAAVLAITVSPSGVFRMSGITFQSGTGDIKDNGTILINGPGTIRVDHIRLNMTSAANYKAIKLGSGIRGVLDSSILDFTGTNAIYPYNGRFHPSNGEIQANYEWTQPTGFGTSDFFFVEDCVINGTVPSGTYSSRVWDGFTGAKMVVRFNTLLNCCINETHDTGHAPNDRGTRASEAYGNLVTSEHATSGIAPNFNAVMVGNGTALAWGNSWDQVYKNIYLFKVQRRDNTTYTQIATPDGWGYAGTEFNGVGSNWDGGTYNGTDTVYGYPNLDQPGRGPGDLITGEAPSQVNSTTGTIAWPNQALEPVYLWNNIGDFVDGWSGNIATNHAGEERVQENRDYYLPASGIQTSPSSPFNGTVGVGWGTLANRPTTCTAGVAYFAIDQGSWNQSATNPYGVQQNGSSGVLYKATATNTWEAYYEPYTYPHPIRGEFAVVEAPTMEPVGDTYFGNQSVEISTTTTGATIKYTIDGSTPSPSHGTVYSAPIGVASNLTIKAMAYKSGFNDSSVSTEIYIIEGPEDPPVASAGGLTANIINLAG